MRFFTFLFYIFFFSINITFAQPPCSGPGATAQTGIAVCGTLVFPQANVPSCDGPNLPPSGCTDQVTSSNSVWYKFHCYQTGTLGFLISPNSPGDDYDWELMDYTGHPPGDVYLINLRVSLNLSGITGPTGCTAAGTTDINCAGGLPGSQFNSMPTVFAGDDYMLMVTNWSNSGLGYNLTFNGGTAVLTNNQPPSIANVGIVGCNASSLKISFSEDVLCSSITPLGTEFTITNGTYTITGISSACSTGANSVTEITLLLQNPIPPGNYRLTVNNGSDLNTVLDVCDDPMPVGSYFDFIVPSNPPVTITNINYTGCAPTALDVSLSKPIWCSSITGSGSEFSILPGNPAIASVQSTCSSGGLYTDQLHIVLQNPLPYGNYQLLVNNGTDGDTFIDTCNNVLAGGSNVPFTITQTTVAPVIQSIVFDECLPYKLVLNFDKPVNCASFTSMGTEFSISPGVWPVGSILSNCGANTYTQQITLLLQNSLPGGNYAVNINNGSDGNTLSDTCFAFIVPGYSKSFTATQTPPPIYDSVQIDNCDPTFIKVFYSKPIQCGSVYVGGSEFYVTGPAPVNISFVSGDVTCASIPGYTHWLLLHLSQPINTFGTYVLHNRWGPDGNSVLDTCYGAQDTTETISFNALLKPSAVFASQVKWGCMMDTIVLSHPGGNGINSWTWNFSDGTSASGQTVTHVFPVATATVDVKLIVSNGFCSDSASSTFSLGNTFQSAFTSNPVDTFCINTPVSFTDASTGIILGYLWDFGDNTQFNGQNPPPHIYASNNIYTVQLMVTDNHGCIDTASKSLHVTATAFIDFTGLKPQYCVDNKVMLTRRISPNIVSYLWDNGDGKTFQNNVKIQFSYPNEGVYTITITGNDRYCGPTQVVKTVPVYAVPKVNLGSDTILCPAERILIGVPPAGTYSYLWNTGATTSQILTDVFTSSYTLLADNHGCSGTDNISVKVLSACLIRVPGAFTPNGDGKNDKLNAMNADLAKNFSLKIFNRLGQLLFSTNDPLAGWDGTYKGVKAETGTYVWMLSYTDPWTGKPVQENGTSILLR